MPDTTSIDRAGPAAGTTMPVRPPEVIPRPAAPVAPPAPPSVAPPAPPLAPSAASAPGVSAPSRPPRLVRRVITRKRAIFAAIVIVIGALVWRALRPAAIEVNLAQAKVGPMQVTVDADAVTRVRAHFAVAAPVAGLVERIPLVAGDSVNRGDVIAVVMAAPA